MRLDSQVTAMLSKLVSDDSGLLELEVRFGKIKHDGISHFQTGVDLPWFEKVKDYLSSHNWILLEESNYKQYKTGQRRTRVFSNGDIERIRKRVMSHHTIYTSKSKDVRISLSQEKADGELALQDLRFDWVFKKTYMWDVFKFDLTRTKKYLGKKFSWENRVELEISNSIHQTASVALLQKNLEEVIDQVMLI